MPAKRTKKNRDRVVGVRYTNAEYESVSTLAAQSKLKLGTWIHQQTLLLVEGDQKK